MKATNFEVFFLEDAEKDYKQLDGSVKKLIDIALGKMEQRADELGDELTSKHGLHLIGCRKIKFRKIGIRIVYRIVEDKVDVVEIIAIGKREDTKVYYEAYKRLQKLNKDIK